MRYIDIRHVCSKITSKIITDLQNKHKDLLNGDDEFKNSVIKNGNTTWGNVKGFLENASNRKCWYTESKNPGCLNDIDHFRPKARKLNDEGDVEYWYWFLAFNPENYRLSCQFSNRLNINPETGETGGKGDQFPLLDNQIHATTMAGIASENPVLIDPCNKDDCDLLEFHPDGRPVVSPNQKNDLTVCYRIEKSKILLNLDFPTFNEDREALYNKIKELVERGDNYGPENPSFDDIKQDLQQLMDEKSAYSKAAECYIRCFRDREWVEQLLF